jgi:hypothetical protein
MAQVWKRETPEQREQVVVTRLEMENTTSDLSNTPGLLAERLHLRSAVIGSFLVPGKLDTLAHRLKFIAANPDNPFASLVYGVTDIFLWPFVGLTRTPAFGGIVLEISSFIALIVYVLISWVLVKIVWLLLYRTPTTHVLKRTMKM